LEGARVKLKRAQEHRAHLDSEVDAFLNAGHHTIVKDSDSEPGALLVRVRIGAAPPSERWSVVLGDALHNYRSALDHAAWALTAPDTGIDLKRIEFPIFLREADFRASSNNGMPLKRSGLYRISGMEPSVQTVIEGVQPYKSVGSPADHDPLWLLQELSNFDKHRILHLGITVAHRSAVETNIRWGTLFDEWHFGPIHHDAVVARFRTPSQAHFDMDLKVFFGISLDEAGPGRGLPLTTTTLRIDRKVRQVLARLATISGM
jgi:hypothetical protein